MKGRSIHEKMIIYVAPGSFAYNPVSTDGWFRFGAGSIRPFRCRTLLVQVGDTKDQIRAKCGERTRIAPGT